MNDFKKDELENIMCALDLWNLKHICSDMKNVQLKIQSMIDNYCEHKWEGFTTNNIRCKKCGKDIWHE